MSTPHRESIYQAENSRVAGKLKEALKDVSDARIDPSTIPNLPNNELSDLIRKWRIWTVTSMGLAQKQWWTKDAIDILLSAKPIFTDYYLNPDVFRRARNFLKDNEGHDYDHNAEMMRDRGKYYQVAYYISGKEQFLEEAIKTYFRTTHQARLKSVNGITMMEHGIAISLRDNLPRERVKQNYERLIHSGFEMARDSELKDGPSDRLAWVLLNTQDQAAYARSCGSKIAQEDIITTTKDLYVFGDKRVSTLLKHSMKNITLSFHQQIWEWTRNGVDFSKIPF